MIFFIIFPFFVISSLTTYTNTPIGIVGVRMKGFIEKLEELLELGGTKRDLKRPVLLFIKFNIWFIFLSFDKGC